MMNLKPLRFALPVVLVCITILAACQKPPVETIPPLTISLAYNQGQCTQNGSTVVIDVTEGTDVTIQGPSATTPFQVQFSSCPFASGKCPANSPQGGAQDMGAPTASAVNNTYYYSSVSIGNQSCNNGVSTFGMHVKPGTGLTKK